ncbi:amidohydrolase family protein [Sphingomonas sp. MMS24-J13]|uniref:amidohydrolase family protein n=1 Tax=Sphingomonas sp. MMS24-J13 TaxID=3238686 RepID=UPI00384EC4E2
MGALAAPVTVYRNARLIDGTGAPARAGIDIVVEGERIVSVAPDVGFTVPADATVIDLSGQTIIPGLIDSHVHLATPPNRRQAEAILRRNLYGGVTAVRDMADDDRAVAELARASRQAEIAAPDIYFAALMAGPPFFADPRVSAAGKGWAAGAAPWLQAIDDKTNIHEAVTLARGTGATAIKIYADLPPHLIDAITAEAHRQRLLVWAHSSVFPTRPAEVIAAGVDAVSHICYLAYQAEPVMLASYEDHTPVNEDLLKRPNDPVMAGLFAAMLKRGTIVDATGSLFVQAEAARKADPKRKPLRCTGTTTTRLAAQAWHAGVPISAGTDYPGDDPLWPSVHQEIFWLVRDVGMSPIEAIRSATLIGARAAGQERDMGSIVPGKLANFVVLTRDPSADIANIRSIALTVKRGRTYKRADYVPVRPDEVKDE